MAHMILSAFIGFLFLSCSASIMNSESPNKKVITPLESVKIGDQIWTSKTNNKFNQLILKAPLICQNLTLLNKLGKKRLNQKSQQIQLKSAEIS